MEEEGTKLLNSKDIIAMFGISRQTLYNWVKGGLLKGYRIAGKRFFKREDINNSLIEINEYRRIRDNHSDYEGSTKLPYYKIKKLRSTIRMICKLMFDK